MIQPSANVPIPGLRSQIADPGSQVPTEAFLKNAGACEFEVAGCFSRERSFRSLIPDPRFVLLISQFPNDGLQRLDDFLALDARLGEP